MDQELQNDTHHGAAPMTRHASTGNMIASIEEEDDSYDSWVAALNSRPNNDLDTSSSSIKDLAVDQPSDAALLDSEPNTDNLADSSTSTPAEDLQAGEKLILQEQQVEADQSLDVAPHSANQNLPQSAYIGQESTPAQIATSSDMHDESQASLEPPSTSDPYFQTSPISESEPVRIDSAVSPESALLPASVEDRTVQIVDTAQLHETSNVASDEHSSLGQIAAVVPNEEDSIEVEAHTACEPPDSIAFTVQPSESVPTDLPTTSEARDDPRSPRVNALEEPDEFAQINIPQKLEPASDAGFDWGEDESADTEWMQTQTGPTTLTPEVINPSRSSPAEETGTADLEDSWAKALGSPGDNLDESWGAAFGEDFEEDGFLEDPPAQARIETSETTAKAPSKSSAYLPQSPQRVTQSQVPATLSNIAPVNSTPLPPKAVSPATNFFAELPSSQPPRARRMKSQIINPLHSQPPAPPGNTHSISAPPPSGAYEPPPTGSRPGPVPFRGPERLDLFPPEPSVAPRSASYRAVPQGPGSIPAPTTTRYPPVPAMQNHGRNTARAPSQSSRYSPSPAGAPVANQSIPPQLTDFTTAARDALAGPQSKSNPGVNGVASVTSRYSPAPAAVASPPQPSSDPSQGSGSLSRHASYTAVNNGNGPPPSKSYAPRTSSPLAQFQQPSDMAPSTSPRRRSSETYQPNYDASSSQSSPKRGSVPSILQNIPEGSGYSQTATASRSVSYQPSPTSINGITGTARALQDQSQIRAASLSSQPARQSRRQPSLDFIIPGDETGADPMQRWKGCPILRWGPGGHVLSTFPKHIPRYGVGQTQPLLKCLPGEINLRSLKSILPIEDTLVSFPGPLKSKNKKKEVLAWLSSHINALDTGGHSVKGIDSPADPVRHVPDEERAILWKVMRVLVENDGVLHGNQAVEAAVRNAISASADTDSGQSETPADSSSLNLRSAPDTADPTVLAQVRMSLLAGDREKAVWHAVDNHLWGHAMLLSSTLDANVWKQVCQEFVRKEIQGSRPGSKPLATLYEIFAGNREDSIDQLVPPSARAGFQMISSAQTPSRNINAIGGLDQWRETLGLILSNRTADDEKAICAMGKLLSQYGRIEAAHICYLFSRSMSHFGGADDPHSNFTLVGADFSKPSFEAIKDLDAILLSEVYEFALSLSPNPSPQYIPHLQAYKLAHAFALVEYGHRSEAQQYCETLSAAMKASTKVSPYYHHSLLSQVEELHKRLSQSPKDGASSWMSKAFNEKTRGGLLAKFNNFIDPGDADTPRGKENDNEFGPFANLAGGSPPVVSRSGSTTDLYGGYAGTSSAPLPISSNARYSSSPYAPRPSQEPLDGYSPYGSYASPSYTPEIPHSQQAKRSPYEPSLSLSNPRTNGTYSPIPPQLTSQRTISASAPGYLAEREPGSSFSSESYMPSAPLDDFAGMSQTNAQPTSKEMPYGSDVEPTSLNDDKSALMHSQEDHNSLSNENGVESGGYQPISTYEPASGNVDSINNSFEPSVNSFQPLSNTYEPPSYQPYTPEESLDEPSIEGRKKSSMFDDDGDDHLGKQAEDLQRQEKARRDKEADDAVKRAAEADAARDLQRKPSGWLGGWFGKKETNEPTVYKAKLGEESSFYYDPDLKKWVNKKAGDAPSSTTSSGTPPPPRGPPSRSVSGSSLPPSNLGGPPAGSSPPPSLPQGFVDGLAGQTAPSSGLPSRTTTPNGPPGILAASSKLPPSGSVTPAPPSRPSTGMSNASSIDDLLGAPQPRKGGTTRSKKKGGRYVDVMAK